MTFGRLQFTERYPRRGESFKVPPRPGTPTTDHAEADWSALVAALYAWGWYTGYMVRSRR